MRRAHISYPATYNRKNTVLHVSSPALREWIAERDIRISNKKVVINGARADVDYAPKHDIKVIAITPGMHVQGHTATASFMWDGENVYVKHSACLGWHRPARGVNNDDSTKHPLHGIMLDALRDKGVA